MKAVSKRKKMRVQRPALQGTGKTARNRCLAAQRFGKGWEWRTRVARGARYGEPCRRPTAIEVVTKPEGIGKKANLHERRPVAAGDAGAPLNIEYLQTFESHTAKIAVDGSWIAEKSCVRRGSRQGHPDGSEDRFEKECRRVRNFRKKRLNVDKLWKAGSEQRKTGERVERSKAVIQGKKLLEEKKKGTKKPHSCTPQRRSSKKSGVRAD